MSSSSSSFSSSRFACGNDLILDDHQMEWIKANRIFTYHAKEFNLWLIGEGWKKGFHFEEGQMIQEEDSGSTKGRRVIETPTEEDVFSALGIPWIEPRDRIGPPKGLQKHDDD